jgi:hypothetical protein
MISPFPISVNSKLSALDITADAPSSVFSTTLVSKSF